MEIISTAISIGNVITVCFGTNLLSFWFYDKSINITGPYYSGSTTEYWLITFIITVIIAWYVAVKWNSFERKYKKV